MTDITQTIARAKALGIQLTSAGLDSEMYWRWQYRVDLAAALFARGDMAGCQQMITAANQYAID